MADEVGGAGPPLSERLRQRPWEFDFFQAVRLLEWLAFEQAAEQQAPPRAGVGEDARPADEVVRFQVPATSAFPAAAVSDLKLPALDPRGRGTRPAEMKVTFLGLIGPSGVLPQHYTSEAIARTQNQDHALSEFLNILQHRAVSLFYRAWRKYRLPFELERRLQAAALDPDQARRREDLFTLVLRSLVGLGTPGLTDRMQAADETALYYSGHYSRMVRSAVALASLLSDHFETPAEVCQFDGRWINLAPDQRSAMPSSRRPRGQHCSLGLSTIVGSRVWDVQYSFRIRLGPMGYRQFAAFLPGGKLLAQLADLVRLYAGPSLDFVVQPVLKRDEVPCAQLGAPGGPRTMLGRNGWLSSGPRTRDADEAVFAAG
jgi:type VI secretion system protein ImpH